MSAKSPVYLTQKGLDELKLELDDLINVKRPANIQSIKEARALGDLSEMLIMMLLEMNKLF